MKAISLLILFLTVALLPIASSQSKYEIACWQLDKAAFQDSFVISKVDLCLDQLLTLMDTLSEEEIRVCNCADSIWISVLKDRRRFISKTDSQEMDTNGYLRKLPIRLDVSNLKQEFRLQNLATLQDSLSYIISRLAYKDKRRNTPENNWQNFYHCLEAEMQFFDEYKYRLEDTYFQIFDDTSKSYELRDMILISFFHSNPSIEHEILSRIESYIGERYFYRMLGILSTSGTDESVYFLINMMQQHQFDLNTQKSILQTIYGITDRLKVKRKTRKHFEQFLEESELDSLSRYDLFVRNK